MKKLSYACNPYLPGKVHVPDGEPHVFGDRLYVYGSHDEVGSNVYCSGSYLGWSAPLNDLSDWRCEGVILEKGQDPLDPDGKGLYYAPDVVQGADGRFYLYYSIFESWVISVAVSDRPEGPFVFYGHVKDADGHVVGSSVGDDYQFDPSLLKDDDGKYYLYSGQSLPIAETESGRKVKGVMVCELETDMLTMAGKQKVISSHFTNTFSENPFFEASSIRKIRGKYYLVYSSLPNVHNLCYAVSDKPDGDFVYGGVLVSNADIFEGDESRQLPVNYWGNNHGGLVQLQDEWYIFYHRNTNHNGYSRQGCAEKLILTEDGRFLQTEITSQGLHGKPLPMGECYPAYTAYGIMCGKMKPFLPFQFIILDEGDPYIYDDVKEDIPYITNIQSGSHILYRYYCVQGNEKRAEVLIRSTGSGILTLFSDGMEAAYFAIEETKEWKRIEVSVSMKAAVVSLAFVYEGTGALDFMEWKIS